MNALRAATSAAILLIALVAGAGAGSSLAQESVAFGIRPAGGLEGFFNYIATPGTTIQDQAVVFSQGTNPIDLTLYPADGITSINGSITFTDAGESTTSVKDWLSTNVREISIGQNQQIFVPFTVNIPPDTPPGDHVAGLVLEQPPEDPGAVVGARTINRVGVVVIVSVPGPGVFEDLIIGPTCANRETGSNYFEVTVKNRGNLLVKGDGTFTLVHRDTTTEIFTRPANLGYVVPSTDEVTSIRLDAPFEILGGTYLATTTLKTTPGSRDVTTVETITLPDGPHNGCKPAEVGGADGPIVRPGFLFGGDCPPWWWFLLILLAELLVIWRIERRYRKRLRDGRPASLRWAIGLITVVVVIAILLMNGCFHWWWILVAILEGLLGIALVVWEYWRRRPGHTIGRIGAAVVAPGDGATIRLDLIGTTNVRDAVVDVIYDPAVVRATSCTADPANKFDTEISSHDFAANTVRVSLFSKEGPSGDVPLADIRFQAVGRPGQSTILKVQIVRLDDTHGQGISGTTQDGSITIAGTSSPTAGPP